jgi:CRISPR system Cascade subunit CasA
MDCGDDGFDKGSVAVYGEYMLMTTKYLLPDRICLPEDISRFVRAAYGAGAEVPASEGDRYEAAKNEHQKLIRDKAIRAEAFQLTAPMPGDHDLTNTLDRQHSDKTGEATVRDGEIAVEVILLQWISGKHRLLPWIDGGKAIPTDAAPDLDTAFTLAGCKVRLPWVFSKPWAIDKTISELEEKGQGLQQVWKDSPWLNGELFLTLDEHFEAVLCEQTIKYDRETGLVVEK